MSWSFYAQAEPAKVVDALEDAADAQLEAQPFDSWDDDVAKQQFVAVSAAGNIAKLIDAEKVNASVSGHAGHGPGQVDSISVSVAGQTPPPPVKK